MPDTPTPTQKEVLDGAVGYIENFLVFAVDRDEHTEYYVCTGELRDGPSIFIYDDLENYPPKPFKQLATCRLTLEWENGNLVALYYAGREIN